MLKESLSAIAMISIVKKVLQPMTRAYFIYVYWLISD